MKIEQALTLAGGLGVYDVVFSPEEVAALRKAEAICDEARMLCQSRFGETFADDALGLAEMAVGDLASTGRLEVSRL